MLSIFELCLSMKKTDEKVAKNRTFLAGSAVATIALVGFAIWLIFAIQVNRPISNLVQAMRRAEGGISRPACASRGATSSAASGAASTR